MWALIGSRAQENMCIRVCHILCSLQTGQWKKYRQVELGHRQVLWIEVQIAMTVEQALKIEDEVVQRLAVPDRDLDPQQKPEQEPVDRFSMVSIRANTVGSTKQPHIDSATSSSGICSLKWESCSSAIVKAEICSRKYNCRLIRDICA